MLYIFLICVINTVSSEILTFNVLVISKKVIFQLIIAFNFIVFDLFLHRTVLRCYTLMSCFLLAISQTASVAGSIAGRFMVISDHLKPTTLRQQRCILTLLLHATFPKKSSPAPLIAHEPDSRTRPWPWNNRRYAPLWSLS